MQRLLLRAVEHVARLQAIRQHETLSGLLRRIDLRGRSHNLLQQPGEDVSTEEIHQTVVSRDGNKIYLNTGRGRKRKLCSSARITSWRIIFPRRHLTHWLASEATRFAAGSDSHSRITFKGHRMSKGHHPVQLSLSTIRRSIFLEITPRLTQGGPDRLSLRDRLSTSVLRSGSACSEAARCSSLSRRRFVIRSLLSTRRQGWYHVLLHAMRILSRWKDL